MTTSRIEKAEEIMDQVVDIDSGSASMLFHLIEQALLEERERTIRECAEIIKNLPVLDFRPTDRSAFDLASQQILSLLPHPEVLEEFKGQCK